MSRPQAGWMIWSTNSGSTDQQRQEIVRLPVGIRIDTQLPTDGGKKSARAIVEYRFTGVVETSTGIREGLKYTVVRPRLHDRIRDR